MERREVDEAAIHVAQDAVGQLLTDCRGALGCPVGADAFHQPIVGLVDVRQGLPRRARVGCQFLLEGRIHGVRGIERLARAVQAGFLLSHVSLFPASRCSCLLPAWSNMRSAALRATSRGA